MVYIYFKAWLGTGQYSPLWIKLGIIEFCKADVEADVEAES